MRVESIFINPVFEWVELDVFGNSIIMSNDWLYARRDTELTSIYLLLLHFLNKNGAQL